MSLTSLRTIEQEKKLANIGKVHSSLQLFWLVLLVSSYHFIFLSLPNFQIAQSVCLYALVFSFLMAKFYICNIKKLEQIKVLFEKEKIECEYASVFCSLGDLLFNGIEL